MRILRNVGKNNRVCGTYNKLYSERKSVRKTIRIKFYCNCIDDKLDIESETDGERGDKKMQKIAKKRKMCGSA